MKKFFFVVLFVVLVVPLVAAATDAEGRMRDVVVSKSQSINGDFFEAGSTVEIAGKVTGDVMSAAGNLDINGTVGGDVILVGGTLDVSGSTGQDLRLAGGNISVSGAVGKNLTAVGGSFRLNRDAQVGGSAYLAGGTIVIAGTVARSLRVAGGSVVISGKIQGPVVAYGNAIAVREGAEIAGDFTYYSDRPAVIDGGAKISGKVEHKTLKPAVSADFSRPARTLLALWRILAGLLVALVAWKLFSPRLQPMLEEGVGQLWQKVGWGAIVGITTPVAAVLAMVTLIGIPLGLIALALYAVFAYLGGILGVVLFGRWLAGLVKLADAPQRFPWFAFLIGAVVSGIIFAVPIFGLVVKLVICLWGFGSLALALKR